MRSRLPLLLAIVTVFALAVTTCCSSGKPTPKGAASSLDSNVVLLFDGLEVIYFYKPDPMKDRYQATVLLVNETQSRHIPYLEITKSTDPEFSTKPFDITKGITIGFRTPTLNGVTRKSDGSCAYVLNPQSTAFHGTLGATNNPIYNLRLKPNYSTLAIRVNIGDGEFTSFRHNPAQESPFPEYTKIFEINDTPPYTGERDTTPYPFANKVGATFQLTSTNPVIISGYGVNGETETQPLDYDPGATYTVRIFNLPDLHGPMPGMTSGHQPPRPLTHFHYYYNIIEDMRGSYMFDLCDPTLMLGKKMLIGPPQNCDPIWPEPPPCGQSGQPPCG